MNGKLGKRKRRLLAADIKRFFHGGNRGLVVGDYIFPPSETGISNAKGKVPDSIYKADRAYVTNFLVDAQYFASKDNVDPVVYVVEPAGDLEPDDDNKSPGRSYACTSAKIVAVQEISKKKIRQARNAAWLNSR